MGTKVVVDITAGLLVVGRVVLFTLVRNVSLGCFKPSPWCSFLLGFPMVGFPRLGFPRVGS